MKEQAMYRKKAHLYDLIYSDKDYKSEAALFRRLIREHKKSSGKELLEVACGTGSYLEHLKKYFVCTGVDLNSGVLAIAKKKNPDLMFKKQDMRRLSLGKQYDIILCLFSSIGYITTARDLEMTFKRFSHHLKKGGVLVIEPWLTKEAYREGTPHITVYDKKDCKIVRMNVAKRRGNLSILDFHWLVGRRGKEVQHFTERHTTRLTSHKDLLKYAREAGLKAKMVQHKDLMRQALIAVKE